MQIISHRKHAVNLTQTERILSATAGGVLVGASLMKRKPAGSVALALAGAELLRRGITGHSLLLETLGMRTAPKGQGAETTSVPYELGIRVDCSITINQPRAEVFRFWRNLSNLPRFMRHIESVREMEGKRSHWVVQGPAGRTVEWDAVVHSEVENERLAWRSLPGADVDHAGSVLFQDAPGGRGTEIRVELQYNPPGGVVSALLAKLWGQEPTQQIEADLRRLKQILEAGEVITTEGQPSGRRADSRSPRPVNDWEIQQASEASFPASDAPAYTR
jgi:uncharacterized membrane protein